jgi:hypothetical protein
MSKQTYTAFSNKCARETINSCYTLTFSEAVENHAKMEIIGEKATNGFSNQWCKEMAAKLGGEIYNLSTSPEEQEAIVVVFRNGLEKLMSLNPIEVYKEQEVLEKDSKAFMYGRVVNKKARHNLCFADWDQSPDYENKKGTIVSFNGGKIPLLAKARGELYRLFGEPCRELFAEGNYYYDTSKCYIGFHGDSERKKVVGLRLGVGFPLHYRWYNRGSARPVLQTINLNSGDIYIMSEKATGNDWKHRSIHNTVRHAAGDLVNLLDSTEYKLKAYNQVVLDRPIENTNTEKPISDIEINITIYID